MNQSTSDDSQQSGFTILELLIATAVLSVILLLVTSMMIGIGNLYYKGINQARVQDAVRNITDSTAKDLQLTNQHMITKVGTFSGVTEIAYCVANVRYTAALGHQINSSPGATQIKHVLWRDTVSSGLNCAPVDLTQATPNSATLPTLAGTSGAELIPVNSRLTDFTVAAPSAFPGTYTIVVGVAYGDDDLICRTSVAGSCTLDAAMAPADYNPDTVTGLYPANTHFLCKGSRGDQFCATAALTTTVVQRINNN